MAAMSIQTNSLTLVDNSGDSGGSGGGMEYPCTLLDGSVHSRFSDRECFVEIGEGQEPIYARVWMMVSQYNALPSAFRNGTGKMGIIMRGQGNDYPATAGMQSIKPRSFHLPMLFICALHSPPEPVQQKICTN